MIASQRLGTPDALILVFTYGVSLKEWHDTGILSREWALYHALAPNYARIIFVTFGVGDDAQYLTPLLTPEEQSKVSVISNTTSLAPAAYTAELPTRIADHLGDLPSAIVKTNQMSGGDVALRITSYLRSTGKTIGLIARGGYPWSQFVEHEKGPTSSAAKAAFDREKALCTAANLTVGTTQQMLADLHARHSLEPARTRLIPNYVEIDRDPSPVQAREPGTLLYAGQLIPRKRVDVLIEALAILPTDLRGTTRLEVIGDGEDRAKLEALAKGLGVQATFTRRIPHADLMARMHRCTIYVQASELEGHPKTVIEAMTTGAPVIVANAPGLEVVEHDATGLKAKPHPRAFAAAIEELLHNPAKRSRLGIAAAQTARRSYSLATIALMEMDAHRDALAIAAETSPIPSPVSLDR